MMKCSVSKIFLFTILTLNLTISSINSAKILCLFPTPSRSHVIVAQAVLKGLAEKGHEVTIVSGFSIGKSIKNYREIIVERPEIFKEMQSTLHSKLGENNTFLVEFPKFAKRMHELVNETLNSNEVQKLMHEESFDLLFLGFFMNDFLLGMAAHFKCPVIFLSTVDTFGHLNDLVGNPYSISTVPHMFLSYTEPMSFKERLINMFVGVVEKLVMVYISCLTSEYYSSNFPPDKYPPLSEVKKNVSLVFLNHHFSQGNPRAYVPSMVEIGGIQIKDTPDPLPEDIQHFLDSSKNGAVYFSMGSNMRSADLPKEKLDVIVQALSKLSHNVLWKFESDLPGLPKNVKISKWLPQDDILAHPNVKLFISHCGLGGVMESKYHGVPIVGIPLFGDQMKNGDVVEKEGWGIIIPFSELTEEKLVTASLKILNDPTYSDTVKAWSLLYRDRPATAKETAIFWVEYVIRHKGAKHMQSFAVHQNFFQNNSIDVWGFILITAYIIIKVICLFFKLLIKLCCKIKNKNKSKNKKQMKNE